MLGFIYRPADENDAASPDVYWHRRATELAAAQEKHTGLSLSDAFRQNDEQRASESQPIPQESPAWVSSLGLPPGDEIRQRATWERFHPGQEWPGEKA